MSESPSSDDAFAEDNDGGAPPGAAAANAPRAVAPGRDLPELPSAAYEGKLGTRVTLSRADARGFRGEAIGVRGRLVDDAGVGMAGRRVDLFLALEGSGGTNSVNVGHAVTNNDGQFAARVVVPALLAVGDYEVFASYYGDDTYRPAISD